MGASVKEELFEEDNNNEQENEDYNNTEKDIYNEG